LLARVLIWSASYPFICCLFESAVYLVPKIPHLGIGWERNLQRLFVTVIKLQASNFDRPLRGQRKISIFNDPDS